VEGAPRRDASGVTKKLVSDNGDLSDVRSGLTVEQVGWSRPGATVFAVGGELDLATIGTLKDEVGPYLQPVSVVVLDLTALQFFSTCWPGRMLGLATPGGPRRTMFALARTLCREGYRQRIGTITYDPAADP
jgi:hypothetical protein